MAKLPVIVGFGGFNAAGRSSFHQAYQRTVFDSLSQEKQKETLGGLATLMGKVSYRDGQYVDSDGKEWTVSGAANHFAQDILNGTLIRRIEADHFDVDNMYTHQSVDVSSVSGQCISFELSRRKLPSPLPEGWQVSDIDERKVLVTLEASIEGSTIKVSSSYVSPVQAAGQLPSGFNPASHYASRFHPRGLQLSVMGASDAVNSIGIPWEEITQHLSPDQVAVYSTAAMSQLDDYSFGGLLQARLKGERVSTKQLALGFNSMPADFINAYVLGSIGATASIAGACASFLYNLQAGVEDIRSGRRRVVVVGSSEAPITPEIIDGYSTMGALATDEKLCKLDDSDTPNHRRASRPFAENCGFTIGESTQQVVLMDDELAVALGATIYGAVSDVFVNADGHKKSISAPGPGNYLTFAKAVASARNLLGEDAVRHRSFVQAHGSSTPQNRVTESAIFDRVAKAFDIHQWPVAAVKAYVGHSIAAASGDQLINSLGVFAQGILPGIKTIDNVAADVHQERLRLSTQDIHFDEIPEVAFLNSKGFGGNNATACVLSPLKTKEMLAKRYGKESMERYSAKNQSVMESAERYNQSALQGSFNVRYQFGQNMISDSDIDLSSSNISIPGFGNAIDLENENIYKDML